jgi:hypothetical protein
MWRSSLLTRCDLIIAFEKSALKFSCPFHTSLSQNSVMREKEYSLVLGEKDSGTNKWRLAIFIQHIFSSNLAV